jgi:hypothetical protein
LIELCYDPDAGREQPKPQADAGDEKDADDKLHKQQVAAQTVDDRPNDN